MNQTEAAMNIAATLNAGRIFANHDSHDFVGIDGRCMWCDCRAFGRHAPYVCPAAPPRFVSPSQADWDAYIADTYVDPEERVL